MSTEDAKAYLSNREVPRLFECLMTGLMFHRPNDHIQYLIDSLEKVKLKGQAELTWNMFVEVRSAKTPLPPITPDNGKRPISRGRSTPKAEEVRPITPASKPAPLPPIGSSGVPNVPVVFIMGGPGSGKAYQAEQLTEKHPGWVNINLGEMLRSEVTNKGTEDKWQMVKDLVVNGELAPGDVTITLLQNCLKNNTEANGFIIQGFPRDVEQAKAFEQNVSRVDAVFLLDCEEEALTNAVISRGQQTGRLDDSPSALARRMATYKEKTLPVLKDYDDNGKLYIVDGNQDKEAMHDEVSIIFETLLQNLENGRVPSPPAQGKFSGKTSPKLSSKSPKPSGEPDVVLQMPPASYLPPPEIKSKDEGRKPELPQAPIIFLAGGPGSGKGTQCKNITARYPEIVHLSLGDILRKEISERGTVDEKWGMITTLLKEGEMAPSDITEELLINSMKEHPDAKAYLVEGYPRDALQYEDFNRNIGGQSFTILLDCNEQYLHDRLILRGASGTERIDDNIAAIEKKVAFYVRNTLPMLKAIEDEQKLIVIDGDRDEKEIFFDIVKCVDFSLYGVELEDPPKEGQAQGDGDVKAEAKDGDGEEAADDKVDGKAPVVEETIAAATADIPTGSTIANPDYTAELDALPAEDKAEEDAPVSNGQEAVQGGDVEVAEVKEGQEKEAEGEKEDKVAENTGVTAETSEGAGDSAEAAPVTKDEDRETEGAGESTEVPVAESSDVPAAAEKEVEKSGEEANECTGEPAVAAVPAESPEAPATEEAAADAEKPAE